MQGEAGCRGTNLCSPAESPVCARPTHHSGPTRNPEQCILQLYVTRAACTRFVRRQIPLPLVSGSADDPESSSLPQQHPCTLGRIGKHDLMAAGARFRVSQKTLKTATAADNHESRGPAFLHRGNILGPQPRCVLVGVLVTLELISGSATTRYRNGSL
jgi:hypothetical protein